MAVFIASLGFGISPLSIRLDIIFDTCLACPTPEGTPISSIFPFISFSVFSKLCFEGNCLRLSFTINEARLSSSCTNGES